MDITSRGKRYLRTPIRTADPTAVVPLVTVSYAVTSPIAPARDLDAGQRAIPDAVTALRMLANVSLQDPEKPTGGNPAGFSASLDFSRFSFAVWQLLVYNETTERG